ncbi:hypothetical protein EA794_09050 [Lactococcus petauri]|uniref:hypothetical protein n=1 Tax=Lactococcus petauri TaxID=1940789 RepID=UPI0013FD8314|nr:hypothetical protein [Lactococcus petauri]NHI76121.1 hypothetical protein [Lactococcus petauri]
METVINYVNIVGVVCLIIGLLWLVVIKVRYYSFLRAVMEKEIELKSRELNLKELSFSMKFEK